MTFETVLYSKQGRVGHLVLNRPGVINVVNTRMRDELYELLEAVRDDPDVRVVVLSGAGGKGFCAGADLTEFGSAPSQSAARRARWQRDLWGLFHSMRKPLIVALHGYVIGTGLEMACFCDIRIAAEDASFAMPELALGLIPGAGGTQTIPRLIGLSPSAGMFFTRTDRRLTAAEALEHGLIHRVTASENLMEAVLHIANEIAEKEPRVLAAVKSAVIEGMEMSLSDGLELETRLGSRLREGAA